MKLIKKIAKLSLGLAVVGSTILLTGCKKDEVCNAPVITSSPQATVNNSTYEFTANVSEIKDQSLITLTLNGSSVPFTFNSSSGALTANLTLTPGTNNISITAKGCETKSNSFSMVFQSNTMRLTGKSFKMTAFTVNPGFPVIGTDIYSQVQPCTKDDLLTFNTNNTATFDEGATKCDPADPQTTTGSWVWNPGETVLTVTPVGSDPISLTIITNDGTTLKGTYTEVDAGVTYTYTVTWTKQ